MNAFPGYTTARIICETGEFALYRGSREGNGELVLLKVPVARNPSRAVIRKIEHEYEAAHRLASSRVVRPLQIEDHAGRPVLVLEDDGNQSPVSDLLTQPVAIERFLQIAISATQSLGEIHRHDLIHKDIRPQNLFYNSQTGGVRIAGFAIASLLPQEAGDGRNFLEGTLAYMSPEQTGRINRVMDYRSDFYSLGVTFYQILTNALPFEASDPLEWIYCHIAQAPRPPSTLRPEIPEALSEIVMRLLAKAAEDRYHGGAGLQFDLERCLQEWRATGRIARFSLGESDFSERLEVTGKLYGREAELKELLSVFGRVISDGRSELALVSGSSGVGKSALVWELQGSIAIRRAFFTFAKFNQCGRDIPYLTIAEGFRELVRQILAQSEERLNQWKASLQLALGLNGQLIVELIPDLEWILGPQPPVVTLPMNQAKHRFHLVFAKFLRLFATAEHPLVLFLDDLQWSDSASLELLEVILADSDTRHLLVIGTYRDNEVTPVHPLSLSLTKIRDAGVPVRNIFLEPLSFEEISQLTAETLHCETARVEPLARLVHEKTGGNPFFAIQFLTRLEREGLIGFKSRAGGWQWDLAGIKAQSYTDNMVDFMVEKLSELPASTRNAMHLASCLGHEESIGLLARVAGETEEKISADLRGAFCQGLILKHGEDYRFLHDQVRQSAYGLASVECRQKTHLRIGRLLLVSTPPRELRSNVFQIVQQLNLGAPLIGSQSERFKLAGLNLTAGTRARESCAYHCATHYLGIGIKLLDGNAWVSRHELAYRLHFEQAQCAYLSSHFEEALLQFRALRVHAKTALAQAEVVRGEVDVHTLAWELREAVDCAIEGLRIFGMEIDAHPGDAQVKLEYDLIWKHLGNRSIGQLADLAPMADAQKEAVLLVLAALQPASFFTDRNLYLFCCCRMVNVSIQHGNSRVSVIAYGALGVSMGPAFGQYREGFEFGQLITRLVERPGLLAHKAEIHFMVGGMINPWLRPLSSCLDWLERGFKVAGDVGDLIFACYCGVQTVLQKFVRGDALDTVDAESERFLEFTRKARSSASSQMILGLQRLILAIRGMSTRVATFESADFSEHSYETDLAGSGPSIVSCGYYIVKLQARFLFGEFEEALIAGSIARSLLWSLLGTIPEFQYHYFDALALAAQFRKGGAEPSLALLEMHHAKLGEWAGNCPETFFHAYALVAAELARIRGDDPKAADFYEQAIRSAHENGFGPNEGIAYELAFRFYMERGFEVSAKAYLHEARGCYARWGAEGKVRQLDSLHPWLLDPMSPERGTVATGHEQLDLMTVVKASQAISSEIDLSHLLDILLRIVQESAGAQKVALLLADDFKIAATLECGQSRPAAPAPASSTVPLSIIHYVIRTQEKVLLNEATSDARFARDEYIVQEKPKSVLCLPILNQSALVGLLYLENNLVPGAFTSDRLAVLELLASQAAISLRNAVLYTELQQENHVRKQAEEEVHQLNAELEERVEQRTMQLRRSLEKEELLRKEVHHRVKNNLQVISSLLYLQSLDSRDPGTQEVLRESQSRTRTIALIHEKLYQSSDVKQIDFDVYTRQLAASLIDSYQPKRGSVRLNIKAEGVLLSPDVAVSCGLIINELVSNALKYAFAEQTGGEIEIDFHPAQDGFFKLRVRDTGRGLPADFDLGKTSTLGVRLVRDLTLQLNGTVEFKSENGTVVDITFPDSAT